MNDNSELVTEARELAEKLDKTIVRGELDGHFELIERMAPLLRTLADIVEAYDKQPSFDENLAAIREQLDALDRRIGQQAVNDEAVEACRTCDEVIADLLSAMDGL